VEAAVVGLGVAVAVGSEAARAAGLGAGKEAAAVVETAAAAAADCRAGTTGRLVVLIKMLRTGCCRTTQEAAYSLRQSTN
jgi:hypothetical protein